MPMPMPKSSSPGSPTVRSRSVRKTPVLLSLLMAGLAVVLIYWLGYEKCAPAPTDSTFTATAYVVERLPASEAVEVRIPIAYSNNDRRRAEEVANALADRYVEDRHQQWKHDIEEPLLKTRQMVEKVRQELAEHKTRLEAYKNKLAEKAAKPQAAEPPKSSIIDNPQWLDLNRRLFDLKQRHDDLLIDRTPLHPAVQDIAMQIEEVEEQLATIPRQISTKLPSPLEARGGDQKLPSPLEARGGDQKLPSPFGRGAGGEGGETPKLFVAANTITDQDQQRLNELITAVESSRRVFDEAEAAEKKALLQQQPAPQYSVVYAKAIEIAPTYNDGWRRLMATTLMAGVLMALGVGTFSAGAAIDPPVGTIGQVRTAAHAPVLGTIPADNPLPDREQRSRRQSRERRTLVLIGLILIAACPAVAYWGIAGI